MRGHDDKCGLGDTCIIEVAATCIYGLPRIDLVSLFEPCMFIHLVKNFKGQGGNIVIICHDIDNIVCCHICYGICLYKGAVFFGLRLTLNIECTYIC